jgi:hypothetical protein
MKKFLFALLLLFPVTAQAQSGPAPFSVRSRTADTIYLDSGKASGIDVGDRLEVLRGGDVIATIEVIFAADRSASAKVLTERQPVQTGDRVRLLGEAAPPPPSPAPAPPAATPEPSPSPVLSGERTYESTRSRLSRTRVTGAVTFDWETFSNGTDTDEERSYDRTVGRLNLRVRDIAGTPLQLRLRARSLEVNREGDLGGGLLSTESRDRLYEAALIYDEPDGRFAVRAGRLGTSPFIGLGYLDGVLAEARLGAGFAVGGLYGRRPDLEELGFQSTGQKLGAFVRFEPRTEVRETERDMGLLLAGIREEGDLGVSREYVTVESRFGSGSRWSFFQHAEVDLNTDWREQRADSQTTLSTLSLTALGQLTARGRLAITYDRFERYFTEEDRLLPEELFDRLWRQGLRVSWQTERSQGLNLSFQGGLRRRQEGIADPVLGFVEARETYSLGLGVHHPRLPGLGISIGTNVLGFTSDSTEGLLVTARAGRRLAAGHEISVSLGGNAYRTAFEEERTLAWGRAALWLELPLDLFGQAEFEVLRGDDDLQGQRLRLGLGYRF